MNTSKPISTISYNSEKWLKSRLEELYRNHTISDWIYIHHDAEEDEKKDHFHVWIEPNRKIDTMTLQDFFREPDPERPDKPLGVIKFQSSRLDDWILYSVHDLQYLASKQESREFAYRKEDFVFADEDTFDEAYRHAYRGSDFAHRMQTMQKLDDGRLTPYEAVKSGILPLNTAGSLLALGKLERNGRLGHE